MLNAENIRDAEQRRLAWRCRRGMLELDIVLQHFVEYEFNTLNLAELHAFDAMLDLPDNQFWSMLSDKKSIRLDKDTLSVIQKLQSIRIKA